ncbi:MAG TPA: hypothetical protein VGA62_03175 [Acidimicrobiia bacterium]
MRRAAATSAARALVVVCSVVGAIIAMSASPAGAHGLGGLKPTDYQTRLGAITPATPGVELTVVDLGTRLELTNRSAHDVVVLGYDGEPYLRVGPRGVYQNTKSPATYFNRSLNPSGSAPPEQVDPKAPPDWRQTGDGHTVSWHDHRAHFMGLGDPPAVRRDPHHRHLIDTFQIRMSTEGRALTARGQIFWVPPPSPWPWVAGAVALAAIVVALSLTRVWANVFAVTLAGLIVTELAHVIGLWGASTAAAGTKLAESGYSIGGILLAVLALAWMVRKGAVAAVPLVLIATIFLFVAGGLADVTTLGNSQVPSTLPGWCARLLVTVTLGAGAGLAAAAALRLRPQPTTHPVTRPRARAPVTS